MEKRYICEAVTSVTFHVRRGVRAEVLLLAP